MVLIVLGKEANLLLVRARAVVNPAAAAVGDRRKCFGVGGA